MNILHIHPSMAGGGIEAMICSLANAMADKGEQVSVCSIFTPKGTDVFWKKLSPKIQKLSLGKLTPGFSISEIFKIYHLLKKGKYDAVNLHGFFYYYALAILLLHHKTKFIYTVHSDAVMENSGWDKRFFFLKKLFLKFDWMHPITISDESKKSFTRLYGIDSKLIYNGVPKPTIFPKDVLKQFRISPRTKIFIHAGRISKEKNQLVLCKVFKTLIDRGFDVVLLIAGSKQSREIYESIEPYFCDRIQYLGERNDIPQLMANSDAMCLPSIWEGLPVTLLEALSVGCIPICSPVGGIPNVITNGNNGFLSKTSSEHDYLSVMEDFLSLTDKEIEDIKTACKTSFAKFDILNSAENYLNYYKSI